VPALTAISGTPPGALAELTRPGDLRHRHTPRPDRLGLVGPSHGWDSRRWRGSTSRSGRCSATSPPASTASSACLTPPAGV